jgi:hypothetical protein
VNTSALRSAGDRISVGNPRMNCVAGDFSPTPVGRSRQPRTNQRKCGNQPAHQSLLNRRLKVLSPALRNCFILLHPGSPQGRKNRVELIDNEHQNTCAPIGSRTGSMKVMTTSSRRSAWAGITSSRCPTPSNQSACANGPTWVAANDRWYNDPEFTGHFLSQCPA